MQRCPPVLVLGCRSAPAGHIHMTLDRRPMQRSRPGLVLGCRIDAMADKGRVHVHTPEEPPMQQSRPVIVLNWCVGTVLSEEPGQIHMTSFRRPMQRRQAGISAWTLISVMETGTFREIRPTCCRLYDWDV